MISVVHLSSSFLTSFLASLVEFVEALTIVLAVGLTRGWQTSIAGALTGVIVLSVLIAVFGPSIQYIPIRWMQLGVGAIVFLFGSRWLIKAVKRAGGVIPLRSESEIFNRELKSLMRVDGQNRFNLMGYLTSFKAVVVEGLEVVFVVVTTGAVTKNLSAAIEGAGAACFIVMVLGAIAHRPLTKVPENGLKFSVGVLLTAFGIFWIGEGAQITWPLGDLFILILVLGILGAALSTAQLLRFSLRR